VTDADVAGEQLIVGRLVEQFPEDGVVAEEGGRRPSSSGRQWFVDPLDGTFNFSRGIPIWGISLALFVGDDPVVGVVHDPVRDETFRAARRHGAWLGSNRLAGSGAHDLRSSVVHVTVDFDSSEMHAGLSDLARIVPRALKTRNLGSAALGLAYVSAGRLDAMVHRFANTWDFGAGALLVEEAGGVISEIGGSRYTAASTNVLAAATEKLHAALVELLSAPDVAR
jgi:myo-inositol-1(or 4)-monophosphatase